jgi:hypothetical protein
VIRDHAWMARETYWSRGPRYYVLLRDPKQCGFVLNPYANAQSDLDHCNEPPEAHEFAKGWVPGPVERVPARRWLQPLERKR